jgi:hypothetical protein
VWGFRTKDDAVLKGKTWGEKGGVQVVADEGMYADDTQVLCGVTGVGGTSFTRTLRSLRKVWAGGAREEKSGQTDLSKSFLLFYSKPAWCYTSTSRPSIVWTSRTSISATESR